MGYPGTVLHRKCPSLGNTPPNSYNNKYSISSPLPRPASCGAFLFVVHSNSSIY
uniref:Uncharacterized protein n=1 Tax=Salmonella phage vB_SEnST11_KE23 TaxID=3161174 RepID=A0AAU8GHW5_9CAUD